jgi:hypothetical protein
MIALELLFAYLHVVFVVALIGQLLLIRFQKETDKSTLLLYWSLVGIVVWCGVVTKDGPYLIQFLRLWNPLVKIMFALALTLAIWELLSGQNKVIKGAIALTVGFVVCLWAIPEYLTGWINNLEPYTDKSTWPDDGQVRDPAFGNVTAAKYGWYLYTFILLIGASITFTIWLRWRGVVLSLILVTLVFVLLVIVATVNLFDVAAAGWLETLGLEFDLPGAFGLDQLFDPLQWDFGNFEIQPIEIELPETQEPVYPDIWPFVAVIGAA